MSWVVSAEGNMNYLHINFNHWGGGLMLLALGSSLACGPGEVTTGTDSDPSTTTTDSGSESSTTTAGPTGSDSDEPTGSDTTETTDTETDATDATTMTTDATVTDSSSETDSETGTDTDTDTDTDSDTDTGGIDCPEPEDVSVEFMLTPEVDEVDVDCVVAAAEEMADAFTIELTCGMESYTVWFASSFLELPGGVEPASKVHLAYASSPGELGPNRWLALQHDGQGQYNTVLGGVSAATLDPPGSTFETFFVGPMVTVVDSVCEPVDLGCGPVERVGLHFMEANQEPGNTIFDQGAGSYAGDFVSASHAAVAEAVMQVENSCEEASATWFEFGWSWVFFGP